MPDGARGKLQPIGTTGRPAREHKLLSSANIDRVVLVTDDAIRQAQEVLWSTLRVVTEPGGAAAFAALLSGRYKPSASERVAVLLCGANTTAVSFDH